MQNVENNDQKIAHPQKIVGAGLVIGLIFNWLFYGKPLGVSLLVFVMLLLVALVAFTRMEGVTAVRRNLWLVLPLLFFATMAFVRANPFLTFLNVVATLVLLAYLVFYYTAGRVETISLLGAFALPVRVAGLSTIQTGKTVQEEAKQGSRLPRTKRNRQIVPVLRGGLLALPLLIVFTALFATADLVFASMVERLFDWNLPNMVPLIWQTFWAIVVAWLVAGGLFIAIKRANQTTIEDHSWLEKASAMTPLVVSIGFVEMVTILILVISLFFLFIGVQFTYLFGGLANISRTGFTFAEYARRGFFELVVAAVFTLLLLIGLNWLTRRESKRQIKVFNWLATVLIGCVLLLLTAAFYRMGLYEAAYGYTELRLYVYLFMLWLGALLLWFVGTLWVRPYRFAIGLIAVVIGFVATINLINPDAFIVKQNLAHYQETGDLDMFYLTTLSADAVPQLMNAHQIIAGDAQIVTDPTCYDEDEKRCQFSLEEVLQTDLEQRLAWLEDAGSGYHTHWQAFNLAYARAFTLLQTSDEI